MPLNIYLYILIGMSCPKATFKQLACKIPTHSVLFLCSYLWTQFVLLSSHVFSAKEIIMQLDDGATLTPTFLQQNGFNIPILILEKTKLGLKVPPNNFTIYDVEMKVGRFYVLLV